MPDYERIDRIEEEIENIQAHILTSMQRMERMLMEYKEMLSVYEDIILVFIKRDMEEYGSADESYGSSTWVPINVPFGVKTIAPFSLTKSTRCSIVGRLTPLSESSSPWGMYLKCIKKVGR